ncbi:MAG: RraA family protein [Candidatus Methanomethylicia archaeon]
MRTYSLEILEKYRRIPTTTISDALDRLNIIGVITGLKPIIDDVKIVGPAFTIKEIHRKTNTSEFRVTEALNQAEPGSIMVFDVGGYTEASTWGGLASLSAKIKGIEGVVVNGAVRDINEIRKIKFPVFARAITPITGKSRIATVSINTQIEINNVRISPGDLIVGDGNGIVVIPYEKVLEVLKIAMEIEEKEEKVRILVMSGKPIIEAERELGTKI